MRSLLADVSYRVVRLFTDIRVEGTRTPLDWHHCTEQNLEGSAHRLRCRCDHHAPCLNRRWRYPPTPRGHHARRWRLGWSWLRPTDTAIGSASRKGKPVREKTRGTEMSRSREQHSNCSVPTFGLNLPLMFPWLQTRLILERARWPAALTRLREAGTDNRRCNFGHLSGNLGFTHCANEAGHIASALAGAKRARATSQQATAAAAFQTDGKGATRNLPFWLWDSPGSGGRGRPLNGSGVLCHRLAA